MVQGSLQKGNGSNGQTLTGSIKTLGETTEKTLGEPDGSGVTGRFGELRDGAVNGVFQRLKLCKDAADVDIGRNSL